MNNPDATPKPALHEQPSPEGLDETICSPFEVPPFDPGSLKCEVRFYWWSWHPNYPNWSRYNGAHETEDAAWQARENPINGSTLDYYHNKLVREGDGTHTVIADNPCRKLDVWWKIKRQRDEANDQIQP